MVYGKVTHALLASMAICAMSGFVADPKPKVMDDQGTPRVVDTSGPKPEWVSADQDSYTQEGKTFYRVVLDNQKNLSRGMELAKNHGFRAVRESVILKIGSAFGMNETYSSNNNDDESSTSAPESAVHTEMAQIAKGIPLSGMKQEASWWEKTLLRTPDGEVQPAYKIYMLVTIPTKFLNKAQMDAAKAAMGLADRTQNTHAHQALQQAMDELKQDGTQPQPEAPKAAGEQ
jgi:hypothetical protein